MYETARIDLDVRVLESQSATVRPATNGDQDAIDAMRSEVLRQDGDFDKAMEYAELAIRKDPDTTDAYWKAVEVTLAKKEFDQTVVWLKRIEDVLSVEFGPSNFETVAVYSEFIQSPQYRQWMEKKQSAESSNPSDDQ